MSGPQRPNQSLQALSHTLNQQANSGCRFQMLVSRLSHAVKVFCLVTGRCDYSLPGWPLPCFQATEVKWMCVEFPVGNPLTPPLMTQRPLAGVLVSANVYDNLCNPLTQIWLTSVAIVCWMVLWCPRDGHQTKAQWSCEKTDFHTPAG